MTARTRSYSETYPKGTRHNAFNGSVAVGSISDTSTVTIDTVNGDRFAPHPFDLTRTTRGQVGRVSGKNPTGIYTFNGYPYGSQTVPSHLTLPSLQPDALYITDLVASTNPSRPEVSLPVTIGELWHLPKSIYDAGIDQLTEDRHWRMIRRRDESNSLVHGNFGMMPIIRDLYKLMHFSQYMGERQKEISGLNSAGGRIHGYRRKKILANDIQTSVQNGLEVHSTEGVVTVQRTTTTRRKVWATVRWKQRDPGRDLMSPAFLSQMRLALSGWGEANIADIWELLPWSWFIDYFVNVGDFLNSTRNALEILPDVGCLMVQTETTTTDVVKLKPAWFTINPASMRRSSKIRRLVAPGLTFATTPLIGERQLLNLASIAFNYQAY